MQDSFRKSTITLPLFGPLVVAASLAVFQVKRSLILTGAQLGLSDSGTGAGNTSAAIKVNGVAINSAPISVAGASASARQDAALIASSPASYPAGVDLKPGDTVTVDITAIPATTAPKGGAVYLDVIQRDI